MEPNDKHRPSDTIKRSKKEKPKESPVISYEEFLVLLKKPRIDRQPTDVKLMSEYLSTNYAYFKNLKESDGDKLFKIVFTLNYEEFNEGENIINFGDKGDKFYILLKGKVSICKPFPLSEYMTLREYTEYLYNAKFLENNNTKFNRIIKQNDTIDYYYLQKINYDYTLLRKNAQRQPYMIEEEKLLAQLGDGFAFGEAALTKKEPRNASIYALAYCVLVSLDELDFNSVLREIEKKRMFNIANDFKHRYPLLKHWRIDSIFCLLNYCGKETLTYGQKLYQQNDPVDYIYFINSGIFEVTTLFSFAWYEEFIDHIHDSSQNIMNDITNRAIFNNNEKLKVYLNELKSKARTPCLLEEFEQRPKINEENNQYDLLKIKLKQDDLMNPSHYSKIVIKTIKKPECIGFEDGLEYKPRFTTIKCLSTDTDIQRIRIHDFLRLFPYDEYNIDLAKKLIFEKKLFIIQQLRNNAMCQINHIDVTFKDKYKSAIKMLKPEKRKPMPNDKKLLNTHQLNRSFDNQETFEKPKIIFTPSKDINKNDKNQSVNISHMSRNLRGNRQSHETSSILKPHHASVIMPSIIPTKNIMLNQCLETDQYDNNKTKNNSKEYSKMIMGKSTEYDEEVSLKMIINSKENKIPRLNKSKSEAFIMKKDEEKYKHPAKEIDLFVKKKALNWSHKFTLPEIKASTNQSISIMMSYENNQRDYLKKNYTPIVAKKTRQMLKFMN